MKEIEVSIIVATFNVEHYIRTCLNSIINQFYDKWECIVVDGNSTDNTLSILKEYKENDSRITYISEKDNGIYDAFNKGLKLSNGKWIYYLGADDTLIADAFFNLFTKYDHIIKSADIIGGGVNLIRNNILYKQQFSCKTMGCHQSFLVSRKVLNEMSGFNEKYRLLADRDLLVRIQMDIHYKIVNLPVIIANFSLGGKSQSLSYLNQVTKERYDIYKLSGLVRFPFLFCLMIYLQTIASRLKWYFTDFFDKKYKFKQSIFSVLRMI